MSQYEDIAQKCWALHREIIEEKKKYVSDKIIEQCNEFCGLLKNDKKKESSEDENDQKEPTPKPKPKKPLKNGKTGK